MEDLLLQEASLSRSLKKTYDAIKQQSKGRKNEQFYANCILATYKSEGRTITEAFKKKMAIKSGITTVKLEKDLIKFQSQLPKTDHQIATALGIKLKASFSIEPKFVEFKSKYFETLSASQQQSTSSEPLAVVAFYKEQSRHSNVSKARYIKEFKKGAGLFESLCKQYDLLMNPSANKPKVKNSTKLQIAKQEIEKPILKYLAEEPENTAPIKRQSKKRTNTPSIVTKRQKSNIPVVHPYPYPTFSKSLPVDQSPQFQRVWQLLGK